MRGVALVACFLNFAKNCAPVDLEEVGDLLHRSVHGDGLLQEIPFDIGHDALQWSSARQDGLGIGLVLGVAFEDVGGEVAGGDDGPLVGDD